MQNNTSGPYVAPVFSPPPYAVAVNALFFASLGVVLVAAFLCMLAKGWIRELDRNLQGIPDLKKRAVIKELREQGLVRWRFREMIAILPSLIHLSRVLFFIGLALYLFQVHILPALLSILIFGLGILLYVLSVFISTIDDFSPFRSPYSRALGVLYRHLDTRLVSPLRYHHRDPYLPPSRRLSSFMALPRTAAESIRERISTFVSEHEPLSEQAILDASSSLEHVISQTSASVLNKLWSSVNTTDTSAYAKNISTSILLQLDDLNIRAPQWWYLPWLYETSNLSIKEAECLVYNICLKELPFLPDSPPFWYIIHASVELLDQQSNPWFHLVTLFVRTKVECNWDALKSRPWRVGVWGGGNKSNIYKREADILQAISDLGKISEDQWCFVLSSTSTLIYGRRLEEINTVARILVGLLQRAMKLFDLRNIVDSRCFDLWLHTMMSLLHPRGLEPDVSRRDREVLHARDIEECGKGYLRNPNCIRRLLEDSRLRELDPSLMSECLVAILNILIINHPIDRRQIRLVNQYLEIIKEEVDVIAWSCSLSELFPNGRMHIGRDGKLARTVLSLLRGFFDSPVDLVSTVLQECDSKLSGADVRTTTSLLKLITKFIWGSGPISGPELQNPWLALHTNNVTRSSHKSGIPNFWFSDSTPIVSARLDLYDDHELTPEADLIIFFLSSPSAAIACRALRWYLQLEENALTSSDSHHSLAFSTIFRKGLTVDEKRESWFLLVHTLLPGLSMEGRSHFAQTFFGYGSLRGNNQALADQRVTAADVGDDISDPLDIGMPGRTTQADGLGWMEDVWMTFLQGCTVHIDRVDNPWPELSRFSQATYPEPTNTRQLAAFPPILMQNKGPEGAVTINNIKIGPKMMGEMARGTLKILAQLLEAGVDLMPDTLLDRVKNSPLLSDERLCHDTESLRRINVVLKGALEC